MDEHLKLIVQLGATDSDLADIFDITPAKLRRRFGKELKRLRAERRGRINRMIWESAKAGNTSTITLLAKNELYQKTPQTQDRPRRKRFDFQAFEDEFRRLLSVSTIDAPLSQS